ncbi:alcohol oxidase [Dendrothele bispora CBS 962.96]|uniref:Alcohol oxidase n=1 Tax=Dendrothele bispora (strain CBS 962.96) TaxID=1314807 RepID=A0A4S8MEV7_DENBC|nr:alcohol oxidase [Dendrothele bispora CBS 962.96]
MLSSKSFLSLSLLAPLIRVGNAALFTDPKKLPKTEYDFIVIGAGTAGNVVANRLSEDSTKTVLVVEAGLNDAGIQAIEIPFLASETAGTSVDWNYTTVPQPGLNNRILDVPRGFALVGSNYMIWTQGSEDLFNSYAEVTEDPGWSWDAIQPFWKRVSTLVPSTDNPSLPPPPADNPTLSNGDGPIQVNLPNFPTDIDFRVINGSKELEKAGTGDGRFKFTGNMNGGDSIGFGFNQESAGGGQRSSSSTAYLRPILNNRPNLDVLIQTRAMKLTESYNGTFTSVEVAQNVDGPLTVLNATSEIILSAGSIGSSQILLLSGIGPKDELEAIGVPSKINLPGVGKNLADHPLILTIYQVSSNSTFDDILRNTTLFQQTLTLWEEERKGLFSTIPSNVIGFMKIPELEGEKDPSTGAKSANTEFLFANGFSTIGNSNAQVPTEGHFLTLAVALVSPKSKGSLTLKSSGNGTFTEPSIDYGLLSDEWDLEALMQGLRDSETFLNATPWTQPSPEPYIIEPVGDWATARNGTDKDREDFIRKNMVTVFHPIGTARMSSGSPSDPLGVTDARLRVRGVKGLRVIDASVFNELVVSKVLAAGVMVDGKRRNIRYAHYQSGEENTEIYGSHPEVPMFSLELLTSDFVTVVGSIQKWEPLQPRVLMLKGKIDAYNNLIPIKLAESNYVNDVLTFLQPPIIRLFPVNDCQKSSEAVRQ